MRSGRPLPEHPLLEVLLRATRLHQTADASLLILQTEPVLRAAQLAFIQHMTLTRRGIGADPASAANRHTPVRLGLVVPVELGCHALCLRRTWLGFQRKHPIFSRIRERMARGELSSGYHPPHRKRPGCLAPTGCSDAQRAVQSGSDADTARRSSAC